MPGVSCFPCCEDFFQRFCAAQKRTSKIVRKIVVFEAQQNIFPHGILIGIGQNHLGRLFHKPSLIVFLLRFQFAVEQCIQFLVAHVSSFVSFSDSSILESTSFPQTSHPSVFCRANNSIRGKSPISCTMRSLVSSGFLLWRSTWLIMTW